MYVMTFVSSCFLLHLSEKKQFRNTKSFLVITALLIPSIIAGVRDYTIGTDVLLYGNDWFEKAISYDSMYQYLMKAKEYNVGVGYAAVNYIVSRISHSPHMFYFVYELLQLTILYRALQAYKDKIEISYAFLVYYFLFFNNSLNILRQAMAIVLVLHSYKFAKNNKIFKFVITIIVAYSFHSSAIVGAVIYPICWAYSRSFKKKWIKPTIVIGSISVMVGYRIIFDMLSKINLISGVRYEKYLIQDIIGGRYLGLGYWIVIMLFLINTRKKGQKKFEDFNIISTFLCVSATISVLPFFGSALLSRISFYFDIFQVILLPIVSMNLRIRYGDERETCVVRKTIVLLPIIVYWIIAYIVRNGAHTYPYLFM